MSPEKKNPFEQLLKSHLSGSLSRPPAEPCPDENCMAAYLEGSQSDHFKKTFEQHLLQCDRCQSEMAFLLKTHETEAKPMPSVLTTVPSPRSNLLTDLLGWTKAATFRPVFAILLVSVVTGVVGYRLLRDDRILRERPVETAESKAPKSSAWPDADNQPAAPPVHDQKSLEQKPSATSEPSLVRSHAAEDRLEAARESQAQPGDLRNKMRSNSQDREMKDGFAAEPPSSAPGEPNRDANGRLERRDVAASTQALPEQLQKESLSASAVGRQNSELEKKADETAANARKQTIRPAAPAGALGALSARKMEQDKPANLEHASTGDAPAKRKQVLAEGKGEAGAFAASEATGVSQIEVGGKRFNLGDGLWRDASILPDDPWPTVVNMLSPDFEKYRKQLALYQPVISRPEDVLIKLHNRVYRIQKARK